MILVTGASGNAGGAVLHEVLRTHQPVRAMYRSERDANDAPPGAERAVADFGDPDSLRAALTGVDSVYLVCGPTPQLVELEGNVIDACVQSGGPHVVLNSALGAGDFPKSFPSWHFQVEQKLKDSGLAFTILRPNGFLQNIAAFYAASVIATDAFHAAMGDAKTSMIDVRDVGAVAAAVLADPGPHAGRTYELNGPEAIGYAHVAARISAAVGRTVTYVDVPESAQRHAMLDAGMPPAQVTAVLELQEYYRSGRCAAVDGTVAGLSGRPARTLDAYLSEHASNFTPGMSGDWRAWQPRGLTAGEGK